MVEDNSIDYNLLDNIRTSFNIITDNIKSSYINYKSDENQLNYDKYKNDENILNSVYTDIFENKNKLETNISKKNTYIKKKSDQINVLQNEISQLKSRYNNLLSGDKASYGLNMQQEDLYILNRYNLFLTLFGILVISTITFKAYNKEMFDSNQKLIQKIEQTPISSQSSQSQSQSQSQEIK